MWLLKVIATHLRLIKRYHFSKSYDKMLRKLMKENEGNYSLENDVIINDDFLHIRIKNTKAHRSIRIDSKRFGEEYLRPHKSMDRSVNVIPNLVTTIMLKNFIKRKKKLDKKISKRYIDEAFNEKI